MKRTRNNETPDSTQEYQVLDEVDEILDSTQEYQVLDEDEEEDDKNLKLEKEPSNPSHMPQSHSKISPDRIRVFPNKYFILAHGRLADKKFPFVIKNVKHITRPGTILLTKVYRNKGTIVFPLLHYVCNDMIIPEENITEDFILSSSEKTWDYDGVYLCKNGIASRIMPFKDETINKRLSSVVRLIYDYNRDEMENADYTIGVLTCLKESNPTLNKNPSFCDYKELSPKNCKELELNPGECVIIGGKTNAKSKKRFIKNKKTKRRKKKHSRKKTVHTKHRGR